MERATHTFIKYLLQPNRGRPDNNTLIPGRNKPEYTINVYMYSEVFVGATWNLFGKVL